MDTSEIDKVLFSAFPFTAKYSMPTYFMPISKPKKKLVKEIINVEGQVFKVGDQVVLKPEIEEACYGTCSCGYPEVGVVIDFEPNEHPSQTHRDKVVGTWSMFCDFPHFGGRWRAHPDEMALAGNPNLLPKYSSWAELEGQGKYRRNGSRKSGLSLWGIRANLPLAELAADFYTLVDLELDFPNDAKVKGELERVTDLLAEQFERYLNMVVGGEVRHCKRSSSRIPTEFLENPVIVKLVKSLPHSSSNKRGRNSEWACWKSFQDKEGIIPSVKALHELFGKLKWEGSYGGQKWAVITHTLLMYLEGEISKRIFVDTTLGLKHNGSVVFDKVSWLTRDLLYVLDYNKEGHTTGVRKFTSTSVNTIHSKLRGGKSGK